LHVDVFIVENLRLDQAEFSLVRLVVVVPLKVDSCIAKNGLELVWRKLIVLPDEQLDEASDESDGEVEVSLVSSVPLVFELVHHFVQEESVVKVDELTTVSAKKVDELLHREAVVHNFL
jgi:hypothetical protein